MKLSRLGRALSITCSVLALGCLAARADDPRLSPPDSAEDHQHSQLYYSEPGPKVETTLYHDGTTQEVETHNVWRPMCGSDMGDMTQEQFAEFVQTLKAQAAAMPHELMDTPAPHGAGLNINFTVGGSPPAGATAAIAAVETYLESVFGDPINVNIQITFQAMGGGVLGATASNFTGSSNNYSTVRTALINGMDSNDTIQTSLPASSVPVRFDAISATVTNVTRIQFTTANWRAGIGAIGTNPDAGMSINTNFTFDYDPSNGISGGQTCFRSVLVHEVLHALGFISAVDPGQPSGSILAIDIFRFQRSANNPASLANFTSFNRNCWKTNATGNNDGNIDLISAEYRTSDGVNDQASHWHPQSFNPASAIGVMQPALASGVTFYPNFMRTSDLAAMDMVGWDYPPPPSDTTPPTPNPMQFASPPAAVDDTSITMTAVVATDSQNNNITYLFEYLGAGLGGNDSLWQSSVTFIDGGLTENSSFSYCVKARDGANPPVETACSGGFSAITHMTPPTGVTVTNVTATGCDLSANGTFTNLNVGSSGLYFNWVLTSGGADVDNSGWKQVNSHSVTGLAPDTYYTFRAKARNQEGIESSTNQSIPVRTPAATPAAPIVGIGSLDVNPNGNPASVLYAIQCVGTTPNDPVWQDQWVAFDGSPQSFEDFLSDADWGVRSLSALTNGVTYQFAVKAVNSDFVETPLGPSANLTVGGTTVHADCNGDGVFNVLTDTACFVDVLIGVNLDSGAITRSDVNGDSVTDGLDIAYFVDCALTGCP